MGLDTVELVMEIEEAFDISIPDADAERIVTVGDLYKYVLARKPEQAGPPPPPVCLTSVAFYRLRRGVTKIWPLDRGQVRPDARLDELIPRADRNRRWQQLEDMLALRLPRIGRPAWMQLAIGIMLAASGGLLGMGQPLWCLASLLVAAAAFAATAPWQATFDSDLQTVGALTRAVAAQNYGRLSRGHTWNSAEVWKTLQAIVCAQLGVEPAQVTPQASFVVDLGAG